MAGLPPASADRVGRVSVSCVREGFRVAHDLQVISYAGDLPDRDLTEPAVHRHAALVAGEPSCVPGSRHRARQPDLPWTNAAITETGIHPLAEAMRASMPRTVGGRPFGPGQTLSSVLTIPFGCACLRPMLLLPVAGRSSAAADPIHHLTLSRQCRAVRRARRSPPAVSEAR